MPNKYYVYVLRDPRDSDYRHSIFYVGKGTGYRALDHREDALSRIGISEDLSDADPETQQAKEARLQEIHAAGHKEKIDILIDPSMHPIDQTTAFAVEAALIEVLGQGQLASLTNRVRGHSLRLVPGRSFSVGDSAAEVELPPDTLAVVVPVSGIWGGRDYAGTLIQASDDEIWENSRRTWSKFAPRRQQLIRNRADTDNPILLLALAADPSRRRANIIVGVYPLTSARESTDEVDRKGGHWRKSRAGEDEWVEHYNGWVLERSDRDVEIAGQLLHNVLMVNGVELVRPQDRSYVGPW